MKQSIWKCLLIVTLVVGMCAIAGAQTPTDIAVTNDVTVHTITWTDAAGLTGETYNVYMSESPITDVTADGVYLIGTGIAEDEGSYEYQLYTPFKPGGDDVTYYYAVTSVSDGVENTAVVPGSNATTEGESGTTTWGWAMIWFGAGGYTPPELDGDLSEWEAILSYDDVVYIDPTSPDNKVTTGTIDDAADMSGYFWVGTDEDALYFANDATDDYLENTYPYDEGNMWKGDSPEFYVGIYDMRPSDPRHEDYEATDEPDFQIDQKANAGTDFCFHVFVNGKRTPGDMGVTGTEQWCGPRVEGDLTSGYYIESKLPYVSLDWDPACPPVPHPKIGWVLPCNVMYNDTDTPGGTDREGQLSWANNDDAGASWDRPDVWQHQVVVYDPDQLIDSVEQLDLPDVPDDYSLAQNYPNPFNIETAIRYCLRSNGQVTLSIYNLLGQKVKTLVNEKQAAGSYVAKWDGKDENGTVVPSGVYLYVLKAGNFTSYKKMVLMK